MGRRKKEVAVQAPKPTVKNAAYYKNLAQEIAEANEVLEARLERALEDKEYWFQHADKAHKEQEAMLETIKAAVEDTINTLICVHEVTDDINPLDIIYNLSMINRIMQAKFNPETEEL